MAAWTSSVLLTGTLSRAVPPSSGALAGPSATLLCQCYRKLPLNMVSFSFNGGMAIREAVSHGRNGWQ